LLRPLSEHAREARLRLLKAGIKADDARLDAELLARHALGWDRARYIAYQQQPLPERAAAAFEGLIVRRERREPLSYILGTREFYGREFEVTREVLIPRPETELIVTTVLGIVARERGHDSRVEGASRPATAATADHEPRWLRVADVGTGSGCLAVTLAAELGDARLVAFDLSRGALEVAARNAARHGVSDRIDFVERDLRKGLDAEAVTMPGAPAERFDIVVSNPPYVPTRDAEEIAPEVRDHEPSLALFSGEDGLDLIRALVPAAAAVLARNGWLVFEIGYGQAGAARAIVDASGFDETSIVPDLQGIPRTVVARLPRP
jgi:release factor glutamine methyltransferase